MTPMIWRLRDIFSSLFVDLNGSKMTNVMENSITTTKIRLNILSSMVEASFDPMNPPTMRPVRGKGYT